MTGATLAPASSMTLRRLLIVTTVLMPLALLCVGSSVAYVVSASLPRDPVPSLRSGEEDALGGGPGTAHRPEVVVEELARLGAGRATDRPGDSGQLGSLPGKL